MNKQTLTTKQQQIILLLYRFRFLSTYHIQKFLQHTNPTRIQTWLQELTQNNYTISDYSRSSFEQNTKPATYCLASKSKKVIQEKTGENHTNLKYIYSEKNRSNTFKEHCLTLANIGINFLYQDNNTKTTKHFFTKVDMAAYDYFPDPLPDAYIAIKEAEKTKRYYLTLFDEKTPRFAMRARIKQYITYVEEEHWKKHTDQPLPLILVVCPDEQKRRYLYRFIKVALNDSFLNDLSFFLAIKQDILKHGLQSNIWQKVGIFDKKNNE